NRNEYFRFWDRAGTSSAIAYPIRSGSTLSPAELPASRTEQYSPEISHTDSKHVASSAEPSVSVFATTAEFSTSRPAAAPPTTSMLPPASSAISSDTKSIANSAALRDITAASRNDDKKTTLSSFIGPRRLIPASNIGSGGGFSDSPST